VAIVLGTRPEIVKLAGLVQLLGSSARVVHTGQHYDEALSDVFLRDLGLPAPHATLGIGGSSRGVQIGTATAALDGYLGEHVPSAVVVQGDTNSALAGALAANARALPLVHVEAGLRSHDRRMPEEHNRILIDHLADVCCAPTAVSRRNLLAEGVPGERITITGNTVVEAVAQGLPAPGERATLLRRYGLTAGSFVLATLHRPENVDHPASLGRILEQLVQIARSEASLPVLLPLHPRTSANIIRFGLQRLLEPLQTMEPLDYPSFLGLFAESAMAVSDSGGVQEEASVLKRPVLVIRRSSERPEVLGTFAELVESGPGFPQQVRRWLADPAALHRQLEQLPSPYGDGSASYRCVQAIRRLVGGQPTTEPGTDSTIGTVSRSIRLSRYQRSVV